MCFDPKSDLFQLRFTGGKAAQIMALMNGIYVSHRIGKGFHLRYYSGSTGTYWNLEIQDILDAHELVEIIDPHGIEDPSTVSSGSRIANFQAAGLVPNRISMYRWLERRGYLGAIRYLRNELSISGHRKNLDKATSRLRILSGNFVPIEDHNVLEDMKRRVANLNEPNPFERGNISSEVAIHYRLGDMRNEPHRSFNDETSRVIDPAVFREILEKHGIPWASSPIRLLSDEPEIAKWLLERVGIKNLIWNKKSSFWNDLNYMAKSRLFIGSLSQMSVLGGMLCLRNQGVPVFPSDAHGEGNLQEGLQLSGAKYHKFYFLRRNHEVFRK